MFQVMIAFIQVQQMNLYLMWGIDIGSTTIKVVVLDQEKNTVTRSMRVIFRRSVQPCMKIYPLCMRS